MRDAIDAARASVDAFSRDDWEAFRAGLADDAVYDELGTGRRIEGSDAIVEVYRAWKQAFPDGTGTVTNALASGNTAVLEIMWQGTHSGELATPTGQTLPASGKAWKVPAVEVVNVEGGKLTECRHYFDLMTLLSQIGAVPAPESA